MTSETALERIQAFERVPRCRAANGARTEFARRNPKKCAARTAAAGRTSAATRDLFGVSLKEGFRLTSRRETCQP